MKILILTLGSRGDVQPYVALGVGLQAAGHQVTLATLESFAAFVRERGLTFVPFQGDLLALMQTPNGKAAIAGKGNMLALVRQVRPMYRQLLDDAWAAARDVDLVIYHPKIVGGYSIAEQRGIPGILALPLPLYSPTAAFPSPILPWANLGRTLNRLSHRIMVNLASASVRGVLNDWRREVFGCGPVRDELVLHGQPVLRLYSYSPSVVPTPGDWDAFSVATGYWFLDRLDTWHAPAALTTFLRDGPPPVYVGFGSMPTEDAMRTTAMVTEALARTGQRGVLATGWGGLTMGASAPNIYVLDSAPHEWLFPQMAAVVHHGGAGTTSAGLRAGVPSVICPFFGDQPFWGRQVARLGAGPSPIPKKHLTSTRLAEAIHAAISNPDMRACAAAVGTAIRAEDGVATAIAVIDAYGKRR